MESFGVREKKRVLLKPSSITLLKKGFYSVIGEKCLLSDGLDVFVSGIILEVTTRDLLKLNALASTNMAILA